MSPAPDFADLRTALLLCAGAVCAALLAGCAATKTAPRQTDSAQEQEQEPEQSEPIGLEETDFGNLTWTFRPGGNTPETVQFDLVDGAFDDGMVRYELGEIVSAELTGDDRMDAAVQITRLDGNAIDEQWYLWIAGDDGPVQLTLPVARMSRCGTATHSVTAVESGGVQIHESRRNIGEEALACADIGSDERTRIVHAVEAGSIGEWWPVQTDPVSGFGGLCPTAADYETVSYDGVLRPAPDVSVDGGATDGPAQVFGLEPWPVYGEPFPGWVLLGVKQDDVMSCAWTESP